MLALLLAAGITLFLRRRIVRPLSRRGQRRRPHRQAASCRPPFPRAAADETGALLKSMTVMQDNIREVMTREKALRRSAENRLADALETSAKA